MQRSTGTTSRRRPGGGGEYRRGRSGSLGGCCLNAWMTNAFLLGCLDMLQRAAVAASLLDNLTCLPTRTGAPYLLGATTRGGGRTSSQSSPPRRDAGTAGPAHAPVPQGSAAGRARRHFFTRRTTPACASQWRQSGGNTFFASISGFGPRQRLDNFVSEHVLIPGVAACLHPARRAGR